MPAGTPPQSDSDMVERLQDALAHGDDDVFSRGDAADRLSRIDDQPEEPDVFPFYDDENDRWVVGASGDRLDGMKFLCSLVTINENADECPECGNTRVDYSRWDNGVESAERETCTVCNYTHRERLP